MPIFEYKAKDAVGQTVTGGIEAATEEKALKVLEDRELTPLSIGLKPRGTVLQLALLTRINPKEIVVFFRQLSVLVAATIPIVQALRVLVKQTADQNLKKIISEIADDVDGGSRLSAACERHSKVFSDFYVNMIKSGETSGRLEEVLNYLADQKEKDYDLMSKVKGAMIYPAFIISALIIVGVIMMAFVVPKLTSVLEDVGGTLPFATRALIAVSGVFARFWWLVFGLMIGAGIGLRLATRTRQGKHILDNVFIRLPIFGRLFKLIYLIRLTRSLSTLIRGGVPLPKALTITADVVSNAVYKELILETVKQVEDGNPIASVFLESKDIPPMLSHMISVGEQTGRIDMILEKITGFYSRELENATANLVALIEPLIIMVMGLAVGLMVAAIIMPIYNLASNF